MSDADRQRARLAPTEPRWWALRRAQSLKAATYRCPFCETLLHATSEHVLIVPEGDGGRRRHAHTSCALDARRSGSLPTREEWRLAQRSVAATERAAWATRLRRALGRRA